MNNDLISRSVLLKHVRMCKKSVEKCAIHDYMIGYASALSGVEGQIASEQSVDAQPVRHGRWIKCDIGIGYLPMFQCSECGKHWDDNMNFCGECGAKMDGGKREDTSIT